MNRLLGQSPLAFTLAAALLVTMPGSPVWGQQSSGSGNPPSSPSTPAGSSTTPDVIGALEEAANKGGGIDLEKIEKAEKAEQEKAAKKKKKLKDKENVDKIGDRGVGKGGNFYSLEKEIAMGKAYATELERSVKLIDDPVISEYVNRVGQNLVRNSDVKVPVSIKVIDDPVVNAMALPGGFFYVNSGLILKAETEAELAGVMAHEIAHIAARHGTRQATRAQIANFATLPLIFLGWSWAAYGIRQGAQIATMLGMMQFSRSFETEADLLGLQYLYKAGYDPTAFVDFFEKLQTAEKRRPGTMSKIFSTHPLTGDRIANSQANIERLLETKPEYVVTRSEFEDVKGRLQMMQARRRGTPDDPNRPTLKRAPGGGSSPIEDPKGGKDKTDEEERPTLKRRPTTP
jgi:beta-barrel assembly-enhancing protease